MDVSSDDPSFCGDWNAAGDVEKGQNECTEHVETSHDSSDMNNLRIEERFLKSFI